MRCRIRILQTLCFFVALIALSSAIFEGFNVSAVYGDPSPTINTQELSPSQPEIGDLVTVTGDVSSDYGTVSGVDCQLNGTSGSWGGCALSGFGTLGARDTAFNTGDGSGIGVDITITNAIAVALDGKIYAVGGFYHFNGAPRKHLVRLNSDGTVDDSFSIGSGFNSTTMPAVAVQADGKIIVGGGFTDYNGTAVSRLVRLNTDGSIDNTFDVGAGASGTVQVIAIQSDNKVLIGGDFTSYKGTAINRIARLNADGSIDATFNVGAGANSSVYAIAVQSDGKVFLGGNFTNYRGSAINRIVRVASTGAVDGSFVFGTGANGAVRAIKIQPDGNILVGGEFSSYKGTTIYRIARLTSGGNIDGTFSVGTGVNSMVRAILLQSDGKVVIGGDFTLYNGAGFNKVIRVNGDGSPDATFISGTGVSGNVYSLVLANDNKILMGGSFDYYNGTYASRIIRLNTDGTADDNFNLSAGANAPIYTIALQSDGKTIVSGSFTAYKGVVANQIARLTTDGQLDTEFITGSGCDGVAQTILVLPDGRIIIAGSFTTYNGTPANRIARLDSDGVLDESFLAGTGANGEISMAIRQTDGKLIIVGAFTDYDGTAMNRIARLTSNGSLDATFNVGSGANGTVSSVALQSDGKVLIGGSFTSYNGVPINRIARLNTDGSLDDTFNVGTGSSGVINDIKIQSDGKILIGGTFTSYSGTSINRIARLSADGTLDGTFNVGTGANDAVKTILLRADGKIVFGGRFSTYNGVTSNQLARVNSDGSLDTTFTISTSEAAYIDVEVVVEATESRLVIGGNFSNFNGQPVNFLTQIYSSNRAGYNCSVDSSEAVLGLNTIYLRAQDEYGNITADNFSYTTFYIPPEDDREMEPTGSADMSIISFLAFGMATLPIWLRFYFRRVKLGN